MRTSTAFVVVSHDVKQPSSFPRRMSAPGVCNFASLTPNRGVGGAPRDVRVLGGTPVRRALGASQDARERAYDAARQALARRLASHNAGRSPLGAPPWRFFTRGRASFSGIASGSRRASSSQPGRSAWRAGSRASRGKRLQAAAAGRHASLRLQDVSGDALNERGCKSSSTDTLRSQEISSNCSDRGDAAGGRAIPTSAHRRPPPWRHSKSPA